MNGITASQYAGFEATWPMVTVRYRTDTKEQRFVWANPAALKALQEGGKDYPDGAVFAKIGFMSEEDPAFRSSLVPSGVRRYQFMVRDKKKYASTGGWGYALFDTNKVTYEGDHVQQAQACHACHQLVPEKQYVFSKPVSFAPSPIQPAPESPNETDVTPVVDAVKFETISVAKLPEAVKRNLAAGFKSIRSVKGELRNHVFRGTIDEIRPSLIDEAKKSGIPAALISSKDGQFALVHVSKEKKACAQGQAMKSIFSSIFPSSDKGASPYLIVAYQDLCI